MFKEDCLILQNERLSDDLFKIIIQTKNIAKNFICGQFVHINLDNISNDPLLRRPISINDINEDKLTIIYKVVGRGTQILSEKKQDDLIDVLGPLGNGFEIKEADTYVLVGGGIGIAPLTYLSKKLKDKNLMVFLGSKTKEDIIDKEIFEEITDNVFISTEDGSLGHKGFVTEIFMKQMAGVNNSAVLYFCGPDPMLQALGKCAKEFEFKHKFVSMENRMACGVGVCLGCVIDTVRGRERVCKDGPVFEYDEIVWKKETEDMRQKTEEKIPPTKGKTEGQGFNNPSRNLNIGIAGIKFKNPIITASGTFGYGTEYKDIIDISKLGGITVKGVSLEEWKGNDTPRIVETPSGMLNAIGLQNLGVKDFIKNKLPKIKGIDTNIIVNISGHQIQDYAKLAEILSKEDGIAALEVNVSCPNISKGGLCFGTNPDDVQKVVRSVKDNTDLPIIVKLTPNVTDIVTIALACENAGAYAISLINTLLAMSIDIDTQKPFLENKMGGLSGPAVKPVAVRMVYQIFASECSLPIIGMGGIATAQDAIEFILAGASVVACGTGMFANPELPLDIISGISDYMEKHDIENVSEMVGAAHING